MDNFDELLITTGVDRLVKLVRDKGKVEITEASKLLNISISNLEEWAHVLEEEGLIKIEYQITKVYLVWVQKSKKELAKEIQNFDVQKEKIIRETEEESKKSEKEAEEVKQLRLELEKKLEKLEPSLKKIEEQVALLKNVKNVSEDAHYEVIDKAESLRAKLGEIKDAVDFLTNQLKKIKDEMKDNNLDERLKNFYSIKDKISSLNEEMLKIEEKINKNIEILNNASGLDLSEAKKSFEEISSEAHSLKEDIKETKEMLDAAKDTLKEINAVNFDFDSYLEKAKLTSTELETVEEQISSLEKRLSALAQQTKSYRADIVDLMDSLSLAKEVLEKLPEYDSLFQKLEQFSKRSDEIEQKVENFKKMFGSFIENFSSVEGIINDLVEMKKKVEEERARLANESGAILTTIDEEISNYATFQKIKEKASSSVQRYLEQLESLEEEYRKLEELVEKEEKKLDDHYVELSKTAGNLNIDSVLEEVEELEEKINKIKQFKLELSELEKKLAGLSRNLKLLSKQASLIRLQVDADDLRKKLDDVKDEKKSIENKKNKLKEMIKKMWEEQDK